MLSEPDLIELDRREFHQAVAKEVQRIQLQPVDLSTVLDARNMVESKLRDFNRFLEIATPEEKPRLEEEISRYQRVLSEYDAELATRGVDLKLRQSLGEALSAVDVGASSATPTYGQAHQMPPDRKPHISRELRHHRLKIYRETIRRNDLLADMDDLARHVGASKSQLYGMARGDTSRYADDRLTTVLKKLDCSRAYWDNPGSLDQRA
jgi:hypothetical protein